MANHTNHRGHRKKIEIDYRELEKLCHIQCSEQEIADWFHCSVDTIERRVREKFGISFAEYFEKHRVAGKIALRRTLFKLAERHPSMAIFLAKNWLGMVDKTEIVGEGGGPIKVSYEYVGGREGKGKENTSIPATGEGN